MSAPYPGRQSPEPETQTGAQLQDPPSWGRTDPEYRGAPRHSQDESEETKSKLESNPPPSRYEQIEESKYVK
ncbi:hypothetical protein AWENTII_006622 [Aspergillus wentii]